MGKRLLYFLFVEVRKTSDSQNKGRRQQGHDHSRSMAGMSLCHIHPVILYIGTFGTLNRKWPTWNLKWQLENYNIRILRAGMSHTLSQIHNLWTVVLKDSCSEWSILGSITTFCNLGQGNCHFEGIKSTNSEQIYSLEGRSDTGASPYFGLYFLAFVARSRIIAPS